MDKKKIIGLIAAVLVLGLLIGAYFIIKNIPKENEDEITEVEEEIIVVDDSTNPVTGVTYGSDLGTGNFSNTTGYWVSPAESDLPLNQELVQQIADAFVKVTAKRDITGQGDESAYGFDAPTLSISVMTKSGHRQYIIGAKNELSGGYYLKYNNSIYVVDSTLVDACSYSLVDVIAAGSLETIDTSAITSVTVNGEEVPNKEGYSNIGIINVKDYQDKESYGFDGSESKVVVTYTSTAPATDENGSTSVQTTEQTYSFSYAVKDEMTYVMLPDDPCIYNASGTDALFTVEEETEAETEAA
ncbi:MAG: DUF4340 domain-containing protein [Clostridia bacterium]|nr:DUF4340 domain-containing protein [Clostridia bacterium]